MYAELAARRVIDPPSMLADLVAHDLSHGYRHAAGAFLCCLLATRRC